MTVTLSPEDWKREQARLRQRRRRERMREGRRKCIHCTEAERDVTHHVPSEAERDSHSFTHAKITDLQTRLDRANRYVSEVRWHLKTFGSLTPDQNALILSRLGRDRGGQ
jgi:hypothetical protein